MRFLSAVVFLFFLLTASSVYSARDYISSTSGSDNEDGANPVITTYKIDMDGDGKKESVRINYGQGVSDKALSIDIMKGKKLFDTVKSQFGIQANYRIADIDKDGKQEIIIWGGLWDPRSPGEGGITEKTYEGHSGAHRYIVATYKLIRDEYYLWDVYTTTKKYNPYVERQPSKD